MKKLLLTSAAAALVAAPALAGGMAEPVAEPVVVAPVVVDAPIVSDWTGLYAGGSLGTINVDDTTDGTGYGVHAGYNYDLGSVVLGGEVEYALYGLDTQGDPDASVTRLKAKVGYDAGEFLPYITAGGAILDSDDLSIDSENGLFYGVGADVRVTDNVLVGGEYLVHDFDDAGIEADTFGLRVSYAF